MFARMPTGWVLAVFNRRVRSGARRSTQFGTYLAFFVGENASVFSSIFFCLNWILIRYLKLLKGVSIHFVHKDRCNLGCSHTTPPVNRVIYSERLR